MESAVISLRIVPSIYTVALIGFGIGFAPDGTADQHGKTAAKTKESPVVYRPPLRGATSGGRIGGGTRGTGERAFTLSVLAPDHTGLTLSEQPTLYWFVSKTVTLPMEFTVVDHRKAEPLLELKVEPPIEPGFHSISLSRHGVRLQSSITYEWFVALVVDAEQRSSDILAGAEIQRVDGAGELLDRVRAADARNRPAIYAQDGYWYDAIEGLFNLISDNPQDSDLKAQRATLLNQVGLPGAAGYAHSLTP